MKENRGLWKGLIATARLLSLGTVALLFSQLPALAQSMSLDVPGAGDLMIHDTGWSQFGNMSEVGLFLLDVLTTFLITAAIAYHPSARVSRQSVADIQRPKILFIYGLIGMTVGFLVVHHGYLIGFVIFGIGGFLRFRTSGETSDETMRMMLVAILGLCVGLEVPVMAIVITAIAWAVFYVLGRDENHTLEVKFASDKHLDTKIAAVHDLISRNGAAIVATNRARFKPTVEFVISNKRAAGCAVIEKALATEKSKDHAEIADWHLS